MNKTLIAVIAVAAVLVMMASCSIGTLNTENRLRNLVESKQKDNTSEFDNMWKKIQQVAQVPAEKRDAWWQSSMATPPPAPGPATKRP